MFLFMKKYKSMLGNKFQLAFVQQHFLGVQVIISLINYCCFSIEQGVVEGYNGTVFAYGQTGCGKSFSMQGVEKPPAQRGIIPRAFQHIFESVSVCSSSCLLFCLSDCKLVIKV